MNDKQRSSIVGALLIFLSIVIISQWFFLHNTSSSIERKVDEFKPKEIKTIADYQNLIEDSEKKIHEMTDDKWLKVSDIKKVAHKYYLPEEIYIKEHKWTELLRKAEDAPTTEIIWKDSVADSATLVDVSIGITAEQIIKALQSIDPNEFIRHKEKSEPITLDFDFTSGDKE